MAWQLTGQWFEACSCKMNCRCVLGPAEPDQGWCSAVQVYDIGTGDFEGTSLAGARLGLMLDLPGDFFGGIDKARIYFDERLSGSQKEAIKTIFTGKSGGVWEPIAGMVKEWLPPKTARINLVSGPKPSASIEGVGELALEPVMAGEGKPTVVANAPVMAAFGVDAMELANAAGTKMHDPEMRAWESLGAGGRVPFSWRS